MLQVRDVTITILVAAAGGGLFHALSIPAAYLTGSACAVTIYATLLRQKPALPAPMRDATFAVLGAMMGAGITPDALAELATLPIALLGLIAVILTATVASYAVLRLVGGWDRMSSLLGSIPGHFSLVMIVSIENNVALDKVVMAQAFRLFALVTLIPFLLGGSDAAVMGAVGGEDATLFDVGLTVAIALAAAEMARRVKLPAPALMGPMLAATILSGTGLVTMAVPVWLAAPAFVLLGASVGSRFSGIRSEGLPRMLAAAAASFVVAVGAAVAVAIVVAWLIGEALGAVFLAYAPGGLDAMIALTFLLGLDVAFVAVLHTARMILLGFSVPLLIPWMRRRWADDEPQPADTSPTGRISN